MEYLEKLKDPRWQKKRLFIFERDKWICRKCHRKEKSLAIHHLIYLYGCDPWEYPDELLTTYCEDCHSNERNEKPHTGLFESNVIHCPFCFYSFCHVAGLERVKGNDNNEAWEGRGNLYSICFYGECGSAWKLSFGEHKGQIYNNIIPLVNCKSPIIT